MSEPPSPAVAEAAPIADPVLRRRMDALAVKDGVSLGGLSADDRELALALVWAGLPAGPVSEREINAALKAALTGPACWLSTDHVELRRWLCDAGWLQRDDFGRAYRRGVPEALLPERACLARALDGVAVEACVQSTRAEQAARRQARHAAWLAQQAAEPSAAAGSR